MGARALLQSDVERHPVTLQQAACRRDQEHMGEIGHGLVAVECALRPIRNAIVEVGQDGAPAAARKTELQKSGLADGTAPHLRRLILKSRELRRKAAERFRRSPGRTGGRHHHATPGSFRSKSNSVAIRSTSCGMPSPVLQLVNKNGLPPRISCESRRITSRLAPTGGERSVFLMMGMSDCVMPGPFLRGILPPAATSIT